MPDRAAAQREHWVLTGLFIVALLTHGWLATRNLTAGFMPGHEFRQSQTALISYFIDRENDFSLLYEAPIVGKPWVSILLEVPFYEWSVVGLSRATGWSHVVSARLISLTCFYLMLPALWWLLGRVRMAPARRFLVLSLVVLCPVYIFYSRAFLMESMELMCCAWFLVGYVGMMERRRWTWFLLATVAGTGASLIKSATYAVWLVPAAACAAVWLWRDFRSGAGWRRLAETTFWGLAGVVVPLGALRLWIELTDPLKAAHASAWIFTSANLSLGNWGLDDFSARFSAKTWSILLDRWREALVAPWLIIVALVAGLAAWPAQRARIAGLAAVFFLAQLLFPFAYAYQEYYYYACAVFLMGALGFALDGLLDTRLPRWVCGLLVVALPLALVHNYWKTYRPYQLVQSDGGYPFTLALRDFTPRESVVVVSGADWAAMIPLYAERRALMIRNGLQYDRAYLERAFAELADEDVSALVLLDDQRKQTLARDLAIAAFDLEPVPTFSYVNADVYCTRRIAAKVRQGLVERGHYSGLLQSSPPPPERTTPQPVWIGAGLARAEFPRVSPAPLRGRFLYGMGTFPLSDGRVMNAHPDSELWVRAPSSASRIVWEHGMIDAAWQREGGRTDGVELSVTGILPGHGDRELFRRRLDPVARAADRGRQTEVIEYQPRPGEILRFTTAPGESYSYDWAYWVRIEVE